MSYQVQKVKAELQTKVREFEKDIKEWEANGLTKEDASEQMEIIFARMGEDYANFSMTDFEQDAIAVNHAYQTIDSYRETIRTPLFYFEAQYMLCRKGSELISPAGVSPDAYIFVRPSVCVQVNELPAHSNLVYFERESFNKNPETLEYRV